MKATLTTLILLLSGVIAQAGNEYIIRDAEAANALYASLGAATYPDQRGWPLPTGWQSGTGPSFTPSCIQGWKDTVYTSGGDTRREIWIKAFGFRSNNSGGVIPSKLSFPHLESIDFYMDSTVTGAFPDIAECPKLKRLIFWNAKVEGNLPPIEHELLEELSISRTLMSGSIPKLNCPKMKYFSISFNRFIGTIAHQSWPLAEVIRIKGSRSPVTQQFQGAFPEFGSSVLRELVASENAFTGPLPDLEQWPEMQDLDLRDNQMTGPLPSTITMPKVRNLSLARNPIGGSVPILHMPLLEYLDLMTCQLKGTIPNWTLPMLRTVSLNQNKLRHPIPSMSCPNLFSFSIPENELADLPQMSSIFPSIQTVYVSKNRLGFDDLERNVDIKGGLIYSDQDSIDLIREVVGDRVIYRVEAPGTKNLYYWHAYGSIDVTGQENRDSVNIPKDSDDGYIMCFVRNELFPDLVLPTRTRPARPSINPLKIGGLIFLGEGSEWQPSEDDPTYSITGSLSINEFLWFDGTIEIDTEAVSITASGVFSLKNVPIPGGGKGSFLVSEGQYDLKLLGADGRITGFANSALSKLPKIAGISLKLSEIKLLGGATADGISMSGTITIDGLSNGCHEDEPGPTTIEITDLAYTRSEGFSVGGMKVENLGFSKYPKFCVKELSAEYDREKNKLSFGASIAMPYAEVSGGMALIGTAVDSIAWRLEATEHAVPLGNTNMGMSGFFGSISGIQANELDATLGGVFVTMIPKDFVKFDLAGTYKAPATIGALIDGVAIPTPGEDDQYQLKLKGATNYDFAEGKAHLEGEAHIGTSDGEEYFVDGALALDMKTATLALKGSISGGYQIKPFGEEDADEYPYDWINAKLGLPKKVSTEANFVFIKSRMLFGIAHLGPELGDIEYSFNFNKSWRDPDFLNWKSIPATEELRGGSGEIATTRVVIVPDNATRMVVRVKGASTLPASTLTLPNGTTVTGTDASKKVDYASVSGKPKAFWTVLEPVAGRWTINAPSAATGDVIEIFVDALPAPFTFTHTQQSRNVTLTWTPQGNADDSIAFFVVGTGTTADGLDLGAASLMAGTKTITIPMDLPVCTFNIEAQGTRGMDVVSDTSATPVSVQPGTVTAPSMMFAQYYTGQKLLNITWTPSAVNDKNVKSYVIHARNAAGEERLLGEAFRWVGWVSVPYTRQNGDKITVRGVDANGRMGCPTELSNITTDVEELTSETSDVIQIVPHPIDQRAEARFWNTTAGVATITLVDLQGRHVTTLYNGYIDAGPNIVGIDGTVVPSGVYTMLIRINDENKRVTLVVAR
ncbi:MAG: hypothetical protein EHM43_06590 [Ignavibacteriae bacterium]|nr:MAG: hypothetical protein EHM43_06590 [Ignavibacteriota bacterium]